MYVHIHACWRLYLHTGKEKAHTWSNLNSHEYEASSQKVISSTIQNDLSWENKIQQIETIYFTLNKSTVPVCKVVKFARVYTHQNLSTEALQDMIRFDLVPLRRLYHTVSKQIMHEFAPTAGKKRTYDFMKSNFDGFWVAKQVTRKAHVPREYVHATLKQDHSLPTTCFRHVNLWVVRDEYNALFHAVFVCATQNVLERRGSPTEEQTCLNAVNFSVVKHNVRRVR